MDEEETGELPALGVNPNTAAPAGGLASASSPADFLSLYQSGIEDLRAAQRTEAAQRQAALDRGRRTLEQQPNPFKFGSPQMTSALFQLSQAFLSPRPYGGFAGTMANVGPVLAQNVQQMTGANRQREQALAELMESSGVAEAEAASRNAAANLGALTPLASYFKPQEPRSTYDATRGTYVTEGQPVRERLQDRPGPNGQVAEGFLYNGDLIYRVTVNGAPMFVDPSGNPIDVGGAR